MPVSSKETSGKSTAKRTGRRSTNAKEGPKIKYTDKSAGQPNLVTIFDEIKRRMLLFERGNVKVFGGAGGQVILISKKPVEIFGRWRDELWFASALIQKGYVGFYFMPVYGDDEVRKLIPARLMKYLKGKACFHIRDFDEEIFSAISDALRAGFDCWHKRDWI